MDVAITSSKVRAREFVEKGKGEGSLYNKSYVHILARGTIVTHVFSGLAFCGGGEPKNLESPCACAQTLERVWVLTRFWRACV